MCFGADSIPWHLSLEFSLSQKFGVHAFGFLCQLSASNHPLQVCKGDVGGDCSVVHYVLYTALVCMQHMCKTKKSYRKVVVRHTNPVRFIWIGNL